MNVCYSGPIKESARESEPRPAKELEIPAPEQGKDPENRVRIKPPRHARYPQLADATKGARAPPMEGCQVGRPSSGNEATKGCPKADPPPLGLSFTPPPRNPQAGPARGLGRQTRRLVTCASEAEEQEWQTNAGPGLGGPRLWHTHLSQTSTVFTRTCSPRGPGAVRRAMRATRTGGVSEVRLHRVLTNEQR
jgi:hypothetical protein